MPYEGEERCFDGNKYEFVKIAQSVPPEVDIDYSVMYGMLEQLTRIGDILDENRSPSTGYRFQKITVSANQIKYEITISPPARILVMTSEDPVTVNLYDRGNDDIEIRGIDWPLETPLLPNSMSIERLYVTTTVETTLRIFSFG